MSEREILFKGKRLDDAEWVEGYYAKFDQLSSSCIYYVYKGHTLVADIEPETVCQYTGLTDKNGRKIFEGDIVKVTDSDRENQVFGIGDISFEESSWKLCGEILYWLDDVISFEFEVIGNIFDNPELLN